MFKITVTELTNGSAELIPGQFTGGQFQANLGAIERFSQTVEALDMRTLFEAVNPKAKRTRRARVSTAK